MLSRFARLVRRLCLLLGCTLTGSCFYSTPEVVPVQPDPAPAKFEGVTDLPLAPGSNLIRILFIHGMGVHGACDIDALLLHLSRALGVTQQMPSSIDHGQPPCAHFVVPAPTPVPAANANHTALLYRYDLASLHQRVRFSYFRWSTLTDDPKATLNEQDHPSRAILSDWVKTFEQQNLADVVLYGGQHREVLRPALERALCLFVEGTPDQSDPRHCDGGQPDIPTAIITHSLAGYMLMDAMSDIYHPPAKGVVPKERDTAFQVGHYLDQIFMLANQLKMLDLSTRVSEERSSRIVERFSATWDSIHADRQPRRGSSSRQVLAISDPNDILSWEVTKSEFREPGITVANIYLGTAGEVFGLAHAPVWGIAASPFSAHTNYLRDDDVMDIIACGMTGSTINRCAN